MNSLTIIGNLTRDPELRTTPQGKQVCSLDVAVNRRKKVEGQPEADYFRVNAWGELAKTCDKYLSKGKKVCVVGSVSLLPHDLVVEHQAVKGLFHVGYPPCFSLCIL